MAELAGEEAAARVEIYNHEVLGMDIPIIYAKDYANKLEDKRLAEEQALQTEEERVAKEEADRKRLAEEQAARERAEAERTAAEKAEQERLATELTEAKRTDAATPCGK